MSRRKRTELSQSVARVMISALVLSYLLIYSFLGDAYPNQNLAILMLCAFFVYSIVLYAAVRLNPEPVIWRRGLAMVIDLSGLSLGFYLAGSFSGIFYPIFLWVIVGNGLRFGVRYLFVAMTITVATLTIAMLSSDYWRQQSSLGIGLILGIIVLPMFYAVILRELEAANIELKKQIDVTAYAATHDSLTKLHNRFIFMDRLTQAINRSTRDKNRFAVIYINLDKFKHINDIFDYSGGDSVLRNVAGRLRGTLRGIDSVGEAW